MNYYSNASTFFMLMFCVSVLARSFLVEMEENKGKKIKSITFKFGTLKLFSSISRKMDYNAEFF